MNKKIFYIVLGLGLIVVFGYGLFGPKPNLEIPSQPKATQTAAKFKAVMEVEFDKTLNHYNLTEGENLTVLEVLKKVTSSKIETQGEGEKAFVVMINGRKAETAKKEYWALLINDKFAEVGAGVYKIKNGDKIKWEIKTY